MSEPRRPELQRGPWALTLAKNLRLEIEWHDEEAPRVELLVGFRVRIHPQHLRRGPASGEGWLTWAPLEGGAIAAPCVPAEEGASGSRPAHHVPHEGV